MSAVTGRVIGETIKMVDLEDLCQNQDYGRAKKLLAGLRSAQTLEDMYSCFRELQGFIRGLEAANALTPSESRNLCDQVEMICDEKVVSV